MDGKTIGYLVGYGKINGIGVRLRGSSQLILGRSPDADIPIAEDTIGREHARVAWDGTGEVTVEDLGSANGTFAENGREFPKREAVRLHPGQAFYLADKAYQFRLLSRAP